MTLIGPARGTGSRASRRAAAPRAAARGDRSATAGKRRRQLRGAARRDHDVVAVEPHAGDGVEPDERGRRAPTVGGADEHVTRPVVHRVADRVLAAGGGEPAVDQHDDPIGQPLDLVQHVRADDHRPALRRPSCWNSVDQVHPLHGIGTVQRLVEHEHARVGDERGRDLGALAHALAEPVDAAGRRHRACRPRPAPVRARCDRSARAGRRRNGRTGGR